MCAAGQPGQSAPRDGYLLVQQAELYYRDIGQGPPIVILHGGPDFDHTYLLPEMDRLADAYRLIYYDQRGRGKSARDVRPEDVDLTSEIADLDRLREHIQLASMAILGHSWGALLALEYALRHPDRVSHLILLNPAPASADDMMSFRADRRRTAADDLAAMEALSSTIAYQQGDPDAVAAYYRHHFRATLRHPGQLDQLVERLRSVATQESILKGRQIEARIVNETWERDGYDLLPALARLDIPTLVFRGQDDFIPVETAAHIAAAIPKARFVDYVDCGHFAYLDCPDLVHREIDHLFGRA